MTWACRLVACLHWAAAYPYYSCPYHCRLAYPYDSSCQEEDHLHLHLLEESYPYAIVILEYVPPPNYALLPSSYIAYDVVPPHDPIAYHTFHVYVHQIISYRHVIYHYIHVIDVYYHHYVLTGVLSQGRMTLFVHVLLLERHVAFHKRWVVNVVVQIIMIHRSLFLNEKMEEDHY